MNQEVADSISAGRNPFSFSVCAHKEGNIGWEDDHWIRRYFMSRIMVSTVKAYMTN